MPSPIIKAKTATAAITMPAIAPPERPVSEGVWVAKAVGDAVCEAKDPVGVLAATAVLDEVEVGEVVAVVKRVRSACRNATEIG